MSAEVPTLLPEWSKSYSRFYGRPDTAVDWTTFNHSYHGLVEEHICDVVKELEPLIEDINRNRDNVINGYQLGSKPIGKGQFSYVYKAKKNNTVYSVKMIPKKPLNSQQYSMNQVLRQIQTWRMKGYLPSLESSHSSRTSSEMSPGADISADEAMMLMNLQKCRREIIILGRLSKFQQEGNRSNLVQLFKVLDSPLSKSIYMIGEWCDLGELKWKRSGKDVVHSQWKSFHPSVTVEEFAKTALIDVSAGLRFMKSQGCIHRDIKPSNILLDARSGTLKISDFGCCIITPEKVQYFNDVDKQVLKSSFSAELNKIVGTPAFTAPELCNFKTLSKDQNDKQDSAGNFDGFKLDVWSLGITIFCLLHNELPFMGDNEFDTYNQIIEKPLNPYLNGNSLNDLVVGKLLEKNSAKRIDIEGITQEINNWSISMIEKPKKKSGIKKLWKSMFKKKNSKKNKAPEQLPQSIQFNTSTGPVTHPALANNAMSISSQSLGSDSSFEDPVPVTDFLDHYENDHVLTDNVITLTNTNKITLHSGSSPSPFKVDTPIKDMIRINESPDNKQESPTKYKSKLPPKKMVSSKEIMDFKKHVDQPVTNSKISSNTINNINFYLNSESYDVAEDM